MTAPKNYICLICNIVGLLDNIYRHVFEEHIKQHAPLQCVCGHIRGTEGGLLRHQKKAGCHGPFRKILPGINLDSYLRRATQSECLRAKNDAAEAALDFDDWMLAAEEQKLTSTACTQTDDEEHARLPSPADSSVDDLRKHNSELLDENNRLKVEIDKLRKQLMEQKRVNEALSVEVSQPSIGVPSDGALYGFEEEWRRSQEEMAESKAKDLFPEPPKRLESAVHIPESNSRLRKTEKIWKRACEDARRSYNKRHKH